MKDIAVYPGSFDPISNGHLDIIERAAKMFDKVIVLASFNAHKKYLFSVEERVHMLKVATKHLKNVEVDHSDLLVVDYLKKKGAHIIIRGMRNANDFVSEQNLFSFNQELDSNVETIYLLPTSKTLFISSSGIKELALFHDDLTRFVPEELNEFIVSTIKQRLK